MVLELEHHGFLIVCDYNYYYNVSTLSKSLHPWKFIEISEGQTFIIDYINNI